LHSICNKSRPPLVALLHRRPRDPGWLHTRTRSDWEAPPRRSMAIIRAQYTRSRQERAVTAETKGEGSRPLLPRLFALGLFLDLPVGDVPDIEVPRGRIGVDQVSPMAIDRGPVDQRQDDEVVDEVVV